jgi:hypothetical protein
VYDAIIRFKGISDDQSQVAQQAPAELRPRLRRAARCGCPGDRTGRPGSTQTTEEASKSKATNLDTVTVTGSRISRDVFNSVSPAGRHP